MPRWSRGVVYAIGAASDAAAAAAAAAADGGGGGGAGLWSVASTVRGVDFWSESEHPAASRFKSICCSVGLLLHRKLFNAVGAHKRRMARAGNRRTTAVHKQFYRLSIQHTPSFLLAAVSPTEITTAPSSRKVALSFPIMHTTSPMSIIVHRDLRIWTHILCYSSSLFADDSIHSR